MWSMLEECVRQLDEPFRRGEIIGWFRRHHPDVKESTLAAHIQAATANAANRAQNNPLVHAPPVVAARRSRPVCQGRAAGGTSSG